MDGKIEWRSVNYEVPENRHYSTYLELPYPSLVLAREQAGYPTEHKILGKTWELAHAPDTLGEYVKQEVVGFIPEAR